MKILVTLILFIQVYSNLFSQAYNFNTFKNDSKNLTKAPLDWNAGDLSILGLTTLFTYATMHIDKSAKDWTLKNNKFRNSLIPELGRYWGEPITTVGLASGFYLQGLISDNNPNKKLGFEIAESAIYTSAVTVFLKFAFGRERPRHNNEPFSFHPFSFKGDDFLSLSSGHTALAFSLSTVISKNSDSDAIKIISFIPAVLTGFSRVYQNHHWVSDVILGGIIGVVIADFVTDQHKPSKETNFVIKDPPLRIFTFSISL